MKLSDNSHRVPISSIVVRRDERQRRKIETGDLEPSIAKVGLLQPIIIDSERVLIAGERRLTACRNLGHDTIIVRYISELNEVERQIVEMEENLKRQDLDWKEIVSSVGRIHSLYKQQDAEGVWTMTDTAEQLSVNHSTISIYLAVYAEFEDERVQLCGSIREAYNVLRKREIRAHANALEELVGTAAMVVPSSIPPPPDGEEQPEMLLPQRPAAVRPLPPPPVAPVIYADFLKWAPNYRGPKYSMIHCDFPYGIDVFAGPQMKGAEPSPYSDDPEIYWKLLDALCENLDNFCSLSAHIMFWFSAKHIERTLRVFAEKAPSIRFNRHWLIWHKTDNAGVASDPRFTPRHIYETALLGRRSDRQLLRVAGDVYGAPTDKRLHVSTKPEPMLRHFFGMFLDEQSSVLDPTAGSGAALRAADSLGASRVLGLEIDPKCVEIANGAFRSARLLRGASVGPKAPQAVMA